MSHTTLPKLLLKIFTPRTRVQYVIKPLATLAAFMVVYLIAEVFVFGLDPATMMTRVAVVGAVQLPFLTIAFILVIYLDGIQETLADMALTDVLTGLPNRRAFIDRVEAFQDRGITGFLLIIDADHFKQINDTFGHAAGDLCLKAIAKRLEGISSTDDFVGRIGGEEFGTFLTHSTRANLERVGNRLCHEIAVQHDETPEPIRFTLSIGASETRLREPIEDALARADEALYVAKENGRGRLVIWSPDLQTAA